jgi:hypothetical protein
MRRWFSQEHEGGRFEPSIHLVEGVRQRRGWRVDARMRHNRKELMQTWPGNSPSSAATLVPRFGDYMTKPAFHQCAQSNAFAPGNPTSLAQQRIRNLDGRLHLYFHTGPKIWVPISYRQPLESGLVKRRVLANACTAPGQVRMEALRMEALSSQRNSLIGSRKPVRSADASFPSQYAIGAWP